MKLVACGINHNTAELALREQLAIAESNIPPLLSDLVAEPSVAEAVVLSTCNRTEIYAFAEQHDVLLKCLAKHCQIDLLLLEEVSYHYADHDMVRHVLRVASGLDAMVLGEPQVFGQLKQAVETAVTQAAVGSQLSMLFQRVFEMAKKVRTHTKIGACPVSVASTSVSLAQDLLPQFELSKVLLLGVGDTTRLVAKHLTKAGVKAICFASRRVKRAEKIVKTDVIALEDIHGVLTDVDLIFTATASQTPILTKNMFEHRQKPLVIIDIAVPRDVETSVGQLDNVQLYTIDDLREVIDANLQNRMHAAEKAEEMIVRAARDYMRRLNAADSTATLRYLREWAVDVREVEVAKAMNQLQKGLDPEVVLRQMANALSNKLMHPPSVKLRKAINENRDDFVAHVHELFDLTD